MKKPEKPAAQPLDRLHQGPPLIMSPLSANAAPGARTSFDPLTDAPPSGVPSDFVVGDDARPAETAPTALLRLRRPRALRGDR